MYVYYAWFLNVTNCTFCLSYNKTGLSVEFAFTSLSRCRQIRSTSIDNNLFDIAVIHLESVGLL